MSASPIELRQSPLIIGSLSSHEAILEEINAACMPAVDAPIEAYAPLKSSDSLPDTHVLRLINGLEIEEFVPAKVAILLKLSWSDFEATNAILNNIIASLRDSGKISAEFSNILFQRVVDGRKIDVLHLIYACMRFEEGKDVYRLDDLANLNPSKLYEFIQIKELISSRNYLENKVNELSRRAENHPYKDLLSQMLRSMRMDDPRAFKEQYLQYLTQHMATMPETIEQYVIEELKKTVEQIEPRVLFASLYRILKTHDFYGKTLDKIVDLTQSLTQANEQSRADLFQRCSSAFNNTLHLLADYKNMSQGSMTLYSLQHGLIRNEWRKIGALFQREKHKFCDCHASAERASFWPLNQPTFVETKPSTHEHEHSEETVAVFGCNWGTGHRSATANVAEILESHGMHPVNIDVAGDMLSSNDPAKKNGSSSFSTTTIFNKLLQCKAYALINFLRSMTGLNSVQSAPSKDVVRQALQRMLLLRPSQAIITISSIAEPVFKAAEIMGIPVSHINTDIDRSVLTRDKPLEYRHFKSMIAFPEDVMSPQVSTTETPEQIAVMGPPTKMIYDLDRSSTDIDRLRTELERELQIEIPRGKKLVIISSGGNGAFSPYPELLTERFKGKQKTDIPFVAVVLCGKNNQPFFRHVSSVASRLPAGCIVPKEFVAPEIMEKLYRVASYGGGMIGKAGGLTIFELSKCGTRILIDSLPAKVSFARALLDNLISVVNWIMYKIFRYSNYLSWEKINQDFAVQQGFAKCVNSAAEFHTEFDQMLSHTEPVRLTTDVHKFSRRLPEVLDQMKQAIEQDASMQERRKYIYEPKAASAIV